MIVVGARVRAIRNAPDCINNHAGKIGVVRDVGKYTKYTSRGRSEVDAACVEIDNKRLLWFYIEDLEEISGKPTSLPPGYGLCACGAITSNMNIKMITGYLCCDCKREIEAQLCSQ